jgi:hypothetical protein
MLVLMGLTRDLGICAARGECGGEEAFSLFLNIMAPESPGLLQFCHHSFLIFGRRVSAVKAGRFSSNHAAGGTAM